MPFSCFGMRFPLSRNGRLLRLAAALPLAALGWSALPSAALAGNETGAKGAQIYCFMRSSGNNHEVSWKAAYAVIKRQSASVFKTSPEHAAVMITEAIVADPGKYNDCGRYLGDLYVKAVDTAEEKSQSTHPDSTNRTGTSTGITSGTSTTGGSNVNRYAY